MKLTSWTQLHTDFQVYEAYWVGKKGGYRQGYDAGFQAGRREATIAFSQVSGNSTVQEYKKLNERINHRTKEDWLYIAFFSITLSIIGSLLLFFITIVLRAKIANP
jgi:hypothetical protein